MMKNYYSCLFIAGLLLLFNSLNAQNLVLSTTTNNASCNGVCNATIDLTVTGGTTPYTYNWTTSSITQDLFQVCAGTYTVTVTDANGMTKTTSATISQPSNLVITTCVTNVLCNGSFNGSVDLTASGGTSPYTYLWSNGNTTQDLQGLTAGTYTPTVVDNNGCSVVGSAVVTQPNPLVLSAVVTNSSSGLINGAIDLSVAGGSPSYTYSWGNGSIEQDLVLLTPGTYTVTVTDAHNCTKTQSVTVLGSGGTSGSGPVLISGVVTNSGCGTNCTGAITLSVMGAGFNPTYTWVTPDGTTLNQQNLSNLCPGTYCVKVTNLSSNTTASECFTVGQGQSQSIDIQSTNAAFCNYDATGNPGICEMVCPHTTVTYFVTPPTSCNLPPSSQPGVWAISGAEDYTINPNGKEVTVTWGAPGPGLVTFSSNNPDLCFESKYCVTVVEEPVAKFSSEPPAANNTLQLCKGQTVSFTNESLNAEQYEWFFSDNQQTLTEDNPKHTFFTAGSFSVTLIARSNCLCADTTVMLIEVLDAEPPLLDCVGSVCPGETVKYSTSSNCSSYSWNVSSNGTVMDGGTASDNSITVQWGQGPGGSISLSALGCSGAACPQASVFFIPIISDNAEIRGDEFVCPDSEEDYSIDLFDGTEYSWTLSSGGSITSGQGTNKVSVAWTGQANPGPTHWLSVEYYNCYLGCGGQDSIPVKILTPFFIQGSIEKCENAPGGFNTKLIGSNATLACDWVVYNENGSVFWSSPAAASFINLPTNTPAGKYRVYAAPATAGQTCSADAELVFSVVAAPPKPAAIDGPAVICASQALTYEVLGTGPYTVQWTAFNGNPNFQSGNPVNVTWFNQATRWLAARYVSTDGLGCQSDTLKLDISSLTALSITGQPGACEGTVASYSTEAYESFDYQWEIIPAGAGAIKSGQGQSSVEVFWQTPGTYTLRVSTCGLSTDFNVVVWGNPDPEVTAPAGLCAGTSATITTTVPYASYNWQTATLNSVSNADTASVSSGSFFVEVTDFNGCKGAQEFNVDAYQSPFPSLTTADPTGFCNNVGNVSLTTLVSSNGVYSYEWFRDGVSLGINSPVYNTNQYGQYTVVVTNQNGCTGTAPPIVLFNYCLGGPGGFDPTPPGPGVIFCPPGSIQIVKDPSPRCDSVTLMINDLTGQYLPGSANWWTFISGGATIATDQGDQAQFVYPNAGKYILYTVVQLQNGSFCWDLDSLNIEAVAQFAQMPACPGDTSRFIDESSRLPNANITDWAWDFGVPGNTDVSTNPSPGYPYAGSGNYTATLTITAASGCTSSYSEPVLVPDIPAPTFAPPSANCAGNATAFNLVNPADIIRTSWDFGNPASGPLNQSSGNPAYHNYAAAGSYPVSVSVTNTYGCKGDGVQPVAIVANPFSGNITPSNPVICEGKSITLLAPSGPNASYVWSNGSNLQTLVVSTEGVYDVTLTNGNGCTYSPPGRNVEVNPAPVGIIKALEINDLGQIIGVSYPNTSVCEGEDVTLQIQDNGSYTYQWSGGNGSDEFLVFSEDRNNLLDVGTYVYTVTVTNGTTGCTSVLSPFEVTVNPVPSGLSLVSNNVCAGIPTTITYTGATQTGWQIYWNNGETGPVMTTEEAGIYFVRVVNEFGCSTQSPSVVVFPGPNVTSLPSGCHERCNPDTLCLPAIPGIVSWQWYYEGTPVPGATSSQFVATQSGTYNAALVDVNGCQAQSADLTVELYDGFGNILGQVWSDVNNNGIIDGADTLVAFIPVQLTQNGSVVNVNMSNTDGGFEWLDVLSTGYTIQIDTQMLSPSWEVVILSDSVFLSGCGGKVFADLLVDAYNCAPVFSAITLSSCPGTPVLFNGSPVMAGQSQNFTLQSVQGCDSIITVTVTPLPTSASNLNVSACPGSTYSYQGVDLTVGQTQNFTLTNFLGCDSIVTVTVAALPTSASTLNVSTCPGSTYNYQGVDLAVGQTQNFTLTNAIGCDSIVTVTVAALPTSASTLNVSTCPGSTYNYQGVDLAVGQTQNFTLTNAIGCDSIVTVTVGALPTSASTLNVSTCPGSTYSYQGVTLAVGQTQNFTLTNALGCDSIVTVTVAALPTSASTLNVSTCPGSTYTYQGINLAIGQTQNFTLTNALGCDSTVTVTVAALPVSSTSLTVNTCPGSTYNYQGTDLAIGETQNFTLTNVAGCDSTVTVTVGALPSSSSAVSFGVCPNETYTFQGQSLAAGTVQAFTLSNVLGCDSIVTVTIFEKSSSVEVREVNVCPGQVYTYNGVSINIGETKDIHFTNGEGCDSLITVRVSAWPALDFALDAEGSCPTNSTGAISVAVMPGGSNPSGFALNGGAYQSNVVFENLAAGAYTISVQDENACVFEKQTVIPARPNLEVTLPGAFVIPCDSVQITLAPALGGDTTGLQLHWWNGAQTASVTLNDATPVWLDASNACGETVHREAAVEWADANGELLNIYVPNIFAPEAKNSENTMFRAFFGNNFTLLSYRLEVYDRWGSMLFESEQPEVGWTGPFRDKIMEPGVFVWQMWVKIAFCGRELELYRKGDVTVER